MASVESWATRLLSPPRVAPLLFVHFLLSRGLRNTTRRTPRKHLPRPYRVFSGLPCTTQPSPRSLRVCVPPFEKRLEQRRFCVVHHLSGLSSLELGFHCVFVFRVLFVCFCFSAAARGMVGLDGGRGQSCRFSSALYEERVVECSQRSRVPCVRFFAFYCSCFDILSFLLLLCFARRIGGPSLLTAGTRMPRAQPLRQSGDPDCRYC